MRKSLGIKARAAPTTVITVRLLVQELDELVECVAHAADRAESCAYDVAGTSSAKKLAVERAKRLYALAGKLQAAR
jgi:hypothetical protein